MIDLENVAKEYPTRDRLVTALDIPSLHVEAGEFLVVRGPSGSGKTTLLLALGGMLRPTRGTVRIGNQDIYAMTATARSALRAGNIGFVFQMFHLVPYLTAQENVALAGGGRPTGDARALLERVRLRDRVRHRPAELSAGERQRTAVARALLNRPRLILADEPTGNLDPENAAEVVGYLSEYHQQGGTVVVVTHGTEAEARADRVVRMEQGRIVPSA
jgi:putative ABC transport system ATP-binding protein